ncbi:MAG TPA: primosomal protein N' [Candidatus Omnitrophota bacterium]|nr:primosomal protein N' [Candidatus Omnitrophota bacterium]
MKRKIAQVIFNLPIETRFDYAIPVSMLGKVSVGARVKVGFGNKRLIGYVVALKEKSEFRHLKPILSLIDETPILDEDLLSQLKELADYYCCSLGEMIEISLPQAIRKGKQVDILHKGKIVSNVPSGKPEVSVLKDLPEQEKWDFYLGKIRTVLSAQRDVIFLVPEISYIKDYFDKLEAEFSGRVAVLYGTQNPNQGLHEWARIKNSQASIVIGVISAVFAPVNNLGLIIIEEEDNYAYKHDQSPHYHSRSVAYMRVEKEKASLVLSSTTISLETFSQIKQKNAKLVEPKGTVSKTIDVKLLDTNEERFRQRKRDFILSSFLENNIQNTLASGGKVMLFMNRKGFSTFIQCRSCGYSLKCPRCNISLTYHYDKKSLTCRYCNYKTQALSICPNCQAAYMRYSGIGTEKLESEMHRMFPQAKIRRWDKESSLPADDFDILISTQISLKKHNFSVDLLGVLKPDASLNRIDFRAAEKTYSLLYRLRKITANKMIIQTSNPTHYIMQAIYKNDPDYFYKQELNNRRELGFPPFRHLVQVNLRGKINDRVKEVSFALFDTLTKSNKAKTIEIYEPSPSIPSKLRGNFYWNILLKGSSVKNICSLIHKPILEYKRKSGVITTINVDL